MEDPMDSMTAYPQLSTPVKPSSIQKKVPFGRDLRTFWKNDRPMAYHATKGYRPRHKVQPSAAGALWLLSRLQ
jgi:hypothetical protein